VRWGGEKGEGRRGWGRKGEDERSIEGCFGVRWLSIQWAQND